MATKRDERTFAQNFNPDSTAFGRHETFPLRYGWLTKGSNALDSNSNVFTSDEATVKLGVGNNMVKSIRYWLLATRLADKNVDGSLKVSELGDLLIQGASHKVPMDPYLEDEGTLWLIHWLLATNPELATAWYWFFNNFHKRTFSGQELNASLVQFVDEKAAANVSEKTLINDAQVVLRMYSKAILNKKVSLEDALDSPLSLLNLVVPHPDGKTFSSPLVDRDIPVGIFAFCVLDLLALKATNQMPIRDFLFAEDGPSLGSIFRLTEGAIDRHLEAVVQRWPGNFELRETAGIHQLYLLKPLSKLSVLKKHYSSIDVEEAA